MDACRRLFFFSLSLSQFYRIRARSRRESSPGDVEQRGSRFCCCATVYNIRNCVPGCWPIRRRVSVESGGGGSEKSPRGSTFFSPVECCCCCLLVDTLPKHCDNKQTRPRRQAPLFQFVVSFRADAAGWWPRHISDNSVTCVRVCSRLKDAPIIPVPFAIWCCSKFPSSVAQR